MVRELVLRKTSCMSLNSLHGDEHQLAASHSYMEAWVFYVFWTLEQNRVIQYLSVCNRIFKEPEVKTRSYVVICIPQWSIAHMLWCQSVPHSELSSWHKGYLMEGPSASSFPEACSWAGSCCVAGQSHPSSDKPFPLHFIYPFLNRSSLMLLFRH